MGEVWRAWDLRVEDVVAIKIIRPDALSEETVDRFITERRLSTVLKHPGVVSIHDLGRFGALPWFAMPLIEGQTLDELIEALHRPPPGDEPPDLIGLIDVLCEVADTAHYAHGQKVIHRDLKPSNVMINQYRDVFVLDWGIAHLRANEAERRALGVAGALDQTRFDDLMGTPTYMAPEQTRLLSGSGAQSIGLGPYTDIYAMGVILYRILTGEVPFSPGPHLIGQICFAPVPDIHAYASYFEKPTTLIALCLQAMSKQPAARPPSAAAFAALLRQWRRREERRRRARTKLQGLNGTLEALDRLRAEVAQARLDAEQARRETPMHLPVAEKKKFWAIEDQADAMEQQMVLAEIDLERELNVMLSEAPDLDETHSLLADLIQHQHYRAEEEGRRAEALRLESRLRVHDRGIHKSYLKGEAQFSLQTDPPGARARLYRYMQEDRRLKSVFVRELGLTPIRDTTVEHGSYLIVLTHLNCHTVRYPVHLSRGETWSLIDPRGETS
ncbi:MAG: serine/threonine-protein kinase, partial [Myxococcota bacterium]